MKIIEILKKVANGEIDKGTKFILNDNLFIFNGRMFESNDSTYLENCIFLNEKDLNKEVELITPNEKEYLIKFNMRGMDEKESYLKFYTSLNVVSLNVATQTRYAKSHFTKEEMQSIQPVREFLEDMEGKYELVEVEE